MQFCIERGLNRPSTKLFNGKVDTRLLCPRPLTRGGTDRQTGRQTDRQTDSRQTDR
jgi:hypothetical protein